MDDRDWNEGIDHAVEEIDAFEKELQENTKKGGWEPGYHSDVLTVLKHRLLAKKIEIKPPVNLATNLSSGKVIVVLP